jgi:acyl dehydratase
MPFNTDAIGKTFPSLVYAVGREKIREFAAAVGETNPLYSDVEAARAAGYDDVVAPPMFAVVYAGASLIPALHDPDVGIVFAMMVHGRQEFRWDRVVVAGEEITTTTTVKDISSRGGLGFYVFETTSKDGSGAPVCTGIWTHIVRGVDE